MYEEAVLYRCQNCHELSVEKPHKIKVFLSDEEWYYVWVCITCIRKTGLTYQCGAPIKGITITAGV